MNTVELTTRDRILASARSVAQARGYGGLSFRDLAADVGIKAASVYHYFPSKAELGAALARRYWEDAAAALESLSSQSSDPLEALSRYPGMFREALISENRICMCSFMAAEYDELPVTGAQGSANIRRCQRRLAGNHPGERFSRRPERQRITCPRNLCRDRRCATHREESFGRFAVRLVDRRLPRGGFASRLAA